MHEAEDITYQNKLDKAASSHSTAYSHSLAGQITGRVRELDKKQTGASSQTRLFPY